MKHLLTALALCLLASGCANDAHPDRPKPVKADSVQTSPPECMPCADTRRRVADCASRGGSCMGSCNKSDAGAAAACQSVCQSEVNACIAAASVVPCPAYCGRR